MTRAYWGRSAAGIMFFSRGRVLLALRSEHVNEPGTWGIPGGKTNAGERPYDAALRETREELGDTVPPHLVFGEVVFEDDGFRYTTFLAMVDPRHADRWVFDLESDEFPESDEVRWFHVGSLPEDDLHFGVRYVRDKRPDLFRPDTP